MTIIKTCALTELPATYLGLVMNYLGTPKNIAFFRRTCQRLNAICNSPSFLRNVKTFIASKSDPTDFVSKLLRLTSLDLTRCQALTDKTFQSLKVLPLRSLSFTAHEGLSQEGLSSLKGLPLQSLTVYDCYKTISNSFLAHLPPNIEQLHLAEATNLSNEGMKHLKARPISCLTLTSCPIIDDETMDLFKELPLKQLNVSLCESFNITKPCLHGLELLDLTCSQITATGVQQLPLSLTSLNLRGNRKIDAAGLMFLQSMNSLVYLNLESVRVTDEGLKNLQNNTTLQVLSLRECRLVTDIGIGYLQRCPLVSLNLRKCMHVTINGMQQLSYNPNMQLELQGTACTEEEVVRSSIEKSISLASYYLFSINYIGRKEASVSS